MKLAAHELYDLHELAMGSANSVTMMGYILEHATDPAFRGIVETHFPLHVRDYNSKVSFLNQAESAKKALPLWKENSKSRDFTDTKMDSHPTVQPRVIIDHMNDQEMASAYLLNLKRVGREHSWTAMEMANPEIRSLCQNTFMMSCSHAYDVWQYMVQKGYYPLASAEQTDKLTGELGAMYQAIPEDQPPIQQYAALHQPHITMQSDQPYQ